MRRAGDKERGSGVIAVLMALAVLVIAGSVGVYVYHREHKPSSTVSTSTNTLQTQHNTTTSTTISTTTDPYAGWRTYTSAEAGYSLKYPATWTVKTSPGDFEETQITSPGNFQIRAISFTKTSDYWLQPGSSASCGANCLSVNQTTSITVPGYGSLHIDATTAGAGGGTLNELLLLPSVDNTLVASPIKPGVYTTFDAVFQDMTQQQATETVAQFLASSDVTTATLIYKSLSY